MAGFTIRNSSFSIQLVSHGANDAINRHDDRERDRTDESSDEKKDDRLQDNRQSLRGFIGLLLVDVGDLQQDFTE